MITDELVRLLSGLRRNDVDRALERLTSLDLVALLEWSLRLPAELLHEQLGPESCRHANGFDKVSFPPVRGSGARLRLHLWPAMGGKATDPRLAGSPDVHNHRWAFASRVLAGSIRTVTFDARPSEDGRYAHYRHSQIGRIGHEFAFVGRAELTASGSLTTRQGGAYVMRPDTVHQVTPIGAGESVTAVIELPAIRGRTDVYVVTGEKETGTTELIRPFPVNVLRDKIASIHASLTRPH